jgi:hypothetical protein
MKNKLLIDRNGHVICAQKIMKQSYPQENTFTLRYITFILGPNKVILTELQRM